MKRILCIILCFTLLPVFSVANAAGTEDNTFINEALAVLEYMDVYTAPENGLTDSQVMTRGDFAVYTAKAFKLLESGNNVYYADVPRSDVNVSGINALAEAGIITLESREFRPDDAITAAEAAKIMVYAAGYKVAGMAKGGFSKGHMAIANELDIMPRYADANALTYKEALTLLYNTLLTRALMISGFVEGGESLIFEKDDERIIEKLWNIYIATGELTSCYTGSVDGTVLNENEVIIDGMEYNCLDGIDADSRLMDTVDFVYEEKNDDSRLVIYMVKGKRNNESLIIPALNLYSFNETSYSLQYEKENGGLKSVALARNSKIYYNGSLYNGSLTAVMNEFLIDRKKGSIRLKDSDENGTYDVAIIKSYRNVVVEYADPTGNIYYNLANANDNIVLSDYCNVHIKNTNGEKTSITLSGETVLSVAESKDGVFLEIIVCKEIYTGTVNSIESDEIEKIIKTDLRNLKIDASYPENVFVNILYGGKYTFYIDIFGYVAYAKTLSVGGFDLGILLDCNISEEEDIPSRLKIFTDEGTVEKIPLAQKVKLDGVVYKKTNVGMRVVSNIPGTTGADIYNPTVEVQVIRYRLNEAGEIVELDTAYVNSNEDKNNTLTEVENTYKYEKMLLRWTSGTRRFGATVLYDPAVTTIFTKPATNAAGNILDVDGNVITENGMPIKATDEMYTVGVAPVIDNTYSVKAYKFTPDSLYADVIFNQYAATESGKQSYVFDSLEVGLNADDEVVNIVKLWDAATLKKYEVISTSVFNGIDRGDILKCSVGLADNKIYSVEKVYDYKEDKIYNGGNERVYSRSTSGNSITVTPDFWYTGTIVTSQITGTTTSTVPYAKFQIEKGKALARVGSVLAWDWDGNYNNYEECLDITESVPVLIIDKTNGVVEKDSIKKGSLAEIPTYKQAGNRAATIVYVSSWWTPICLYVYI